jgi:hypothetical protein
MDNKTWGYIPYLILQCNTVMFYNVTA